jgi:hypothetical protein
MVSHRLSGAAMQPPIKLMDSNLRVATCPGTCGSSQVKGHVLVNRLRAAKSACGELHTSGIWVFSSSMVGKVSTSIITIG